MLPVRFKRALLGTRSEGDCYCRVRHWLTGIVAAGPDLAMRLMAAVDVDDGGGRSTVM